MAKNEGKGNPNASTSYCIPSGSERSEKVDFGKGGDQGREYGDPTGAPEKLQRIFAGSGRPKSFVENGLGSATGDFLSSGQQSSASDSAGQKAGKKARGY